MFSLTTNRAFVTFSLVVSLAVALFGFASSAFAASSITITSTPPAGCQLSSTSVTVTGSATANTPPGLIGQYHVIINWGDTTSTDNAEASAFGPEDPSTRNFSGTHTYSTPGTYHVIATVYHQNSNGNDNVASGANDFVVCIVSPLTISKTANTSLTRSWTWGIAKTADESDVTLTSGVFNTANYTVTPSASSADSAWAVAGNISITNPTGNPTITGVAVSDSMDGTGGPIAGTVVCPGTSIAAGATMICTYSASLPDGTSRTNTANVTVGSASILNGSATASVSFSGATINKVNDCAAISDTNAKGPQGVVQCAGAIAAINYSTTFGKNAGADVELACGDTAYTNTASFVTDDTSATGNASKTINFHVNCPLGCTLTQGYWKTHNTSFSGGASKHADATWASVGGPSTTFFLSGMSWFQVFWNAPAGNAYFILADQYMAARLNQAKGTTVPPTVATAITHATSLFGTWTPAQVGALKGNNATRQDFITTAGILGNYNEGNAGVPHCTEQN